MVRLELRTWLFLHENKTALTIQVSIAQTVVCPLELKASEFEFFHDHDLHMCCILLSVFFTEYFNKTTFNTTKSYSIFQLEKLCFKVKNREAKVKWKIANVQKVVDLGCLNVFGL